MSKCYFLSTLFLKHSVNECIRVRLATLPSAPTASQAVEKGFACVAPNMDKAIELSDIIGPEHLEIQTANSEADGRKCNSYGALFIGKLSAEVLGDYGAGPNHVLPTSGTAKYTGGLSVFTFLRIRTWMNMTDKESGQIVVTDAVSLARVEGLEGHARAAECRLVSRDESPSKKSRK